MLTPTICGACGWRGGDHNDDCAHRHRQPVTTARVRRPRPRYGEDLAQRARELQARKRAAP